jgi:hypothetical protein
VTDSAQDGLSVSNVEQSNKIMSFHRMAEKIPSILALAVNAAVSQDKNQL